MIIKRIFIFSLFLIIPFLYNFFTSKTINSSNDKIFVYAVNDNKWLIKKDYFGDTHLDNEGKIKYGQNLNKLKPVKNNSKSFDLDNFSFQLFNTIALDNKDNVVISPISISYALLMANIGSDIATSSNIISSLGLEGVKNEHIYSHVENTINILNNKKIHINNSIWTQNDDCYKPNKKYVKFVKDIFKGDIFFVNFNLDYFDLVYDINKWTSDKTNNLIDNIVSNEDIKKSTVQVLINTLFYKNNWSLPFDTTKTKSLLFNGVNGTIKTPMMYQTNYFFYKKDSNYEILKLPFKNSSISLYIILPDSSLPLNDFLFTYSNLEFKKDIINLEHKKGSIYIPKFNINYSISLKDILIDMGMFIPFDPYLANFDKFWDYSNKCEDNPPNHYIDIINHKTNFSLDENGIEATAATSVIMNRITTINLDKQFNFNANRYHFFIFYMMTKLNQYYL